MGRIGCGKSKLVSAIARLVDSSSGSIAIDGVETPDVPPRRLRLAVYTPAGVNDIRRHDSPQFGFQRNPYRYGDFRRSGTLSSETNPFGGSKRRHTVPTPHIRWHRALRWPTTALQRRASITRAAVNRRGCTESVAADNADVNDDYYDCTLSCVSRVARPHHCLGRWKDYRRRQSTVPAAKGELLSSRCEDQGR